MLPQRRSEPQECSVRRKAVRFLELTVGRRLDPALEFS
jgi:hypothetical protein